MKIWALIFVLLLVMPSAIGAVNHSEEGHEEIVDVIYFSKLGCPVCAKLELFLEKLDDKSVDIYKYDVYNNETNFQLAKNFAEKHGQTFSAVPMTYIGGKVFIGFNAEIGKQMIDEIKRCKEECCSSPLDLIDQCRPADEEKEKLTIASVIALAVADSINPCALAVLAMALVALLVKDPKKKKNVLYGGLAFTAAVFITYLIYGGIIIQFFKFLEIFFKSASDYARILFALVAIFLGIMNFKDYLKYRPGTIGTEMPMFLRPSAKRLISNITRPRGAFIIGIFVTLFLLPCTIGPYLVVGNLLSTFEFLRSLPWLVLYNIIFVMPMILVTLLVYFGYTKVGNVTGWKEEHIKYLHLFAGIILAVLGILMLLGII